MAKKKVLPPRDIDIEVFSHEPHKKLKALKKRITTNKAQKIPSGSIKPTKIKPTKVDEKVLNSKPEQVSHLKKTTFFNPGKAYAIFTVIGLLLIVLFGYFFVVYANTLMVKKDWEKLLSNNVSYGYGITDGEIDEYSKISDNIILQNFFAVSKNKINAQHLDDFVTKKESDYAVQLGVWEINVENSLKKLENILASTEGIDIPTRLSYIDLVNQTNEKLENNGLNITEAKVLTDTLDKSHTQYLKDLDWAQKEMLLQNLDNLDKQADQLLSFFNQYYSYNEQKDSLKDYKAKITNFSKTSEYNKLSFDELKTYLETNLYPLVQNIQKYKDSMDTSTAEQKQKWMELERLNREKLGMGDAPVAPLNREKLIYINIAEQKMFVYDNGDLIASGYVTTGKIGHETVTGEYKIYNMSKDRTLKSPFPDEEYELHVDYWMPFFEGYGIHDTCNDIDCWRTQYGGQDYKYAGSHGCINTPYSLVEFVYNWANVGTTVYLK